jgi:hypothetical protein
MNKTLLSSITAIFCILMQANNAQNSKDQSQKNVDATNLSVSYILDNCTSALKTINELDGKADLPSQRRLENAKKMFIRNKNLLDNMPKEKLRAHLILLNAREKERIKEIDRLERLYQKNESAKTAELIERYKTFLSTTRQQISMVLAAYLVDAKTALQDIINKAKLGSIGILEGELRIKSFGLEPDKLDPNNIRKSVGDVWIGYEYNEVNMHWDKYSWNIVNIQCDSSEHLSWAISLASYLYGNDFKSAISQFCDKLETNNFRHTIGRVVTEDNEGVTRADVFLSVDIPAEISEGKAVVNLNMIRMKDKITSKWIIKPSISGLVIPKLCPICNGRGYSNLKRVTRSELQKMNQEFISPISGLNISGEFEPPYKVLSWESELVCIIGYPCAGCDKKGYFISNASDGKSRKLEELIGLINSYKE